MSDVSPPPHYTAFLSYSHRDVRAATRLHRRLEAFRIDKAMVGQTAVCSVSTSLRPIFRDRTDFSAGNALADQTHAALSNSGALIVLASPAASRSHYVNEEVRLFRSLHPTRPIIPIIVSGPEGVTDHDVFPPELCAVTDAGGTLRQVAPDLLAADARDDADGEDLALAKVVARLIGAPPDQVFRRAERERKRRVLIITTTACAVCILIVFASFMTKRALDADKQIDDAKALAVRLLGAGSSVAAQPEAVENLTDAITAISQNSSTDSRYARALAFLRTGKPDEAAKLLEQVAHQAAANMEREKTRTADAYYNLGTIAGLANPKKARSAFAEAALLDPNNVRNLLSHGYYEKHAGNIDEAEQAYKRVLTVADPAREISAFYAAWIDLGDVHYERGDLTTALTEYRKASDIANHKLNSHPDSTRAQREVSLSDREIGNVAFARGDLSSALTYFRGERDLAERLTTFRPKNTLWQRDLSRSFGRVGDVEAAQENFQSALSSYGESLRVAQELANSDPRNLWWQHDLVRPIGQVGGIQLRLGKITEALRAYSKALTISQDLVSSDKDNMEWQYTLADCYRNLGKAAMAQGNPTSAAGSFDEMLRIAVALANNDERNFRWQHLLSSAYEYIARADKRMGDLDATLSALRSGHAIIARLSSVSPDNVEWKNQLNWFERQLASVKQ